MLVLTLAGLFIVSALIGVIAAGIDTKLAELRRGRSLVLEKDHTVILGWSDSVFTIVRELTLANESRHRPVIVVLADRDKVEMEEDIRDKVPDLRGTRVVCRSGSPMDIGDLALSSHATARSVIVLSPGSDDPDSEVIKTLLALTHGGREGPHIVAEIHDPQNLEAARLVGGERRSSSTSARPSPGSSSRRRASRARLPSTPSCSTSTATRSTSSMTTGWPGRRTPSPARVREGQRHRADRPRRVKLNPPPSTPVDGQTLIVVAEDDSALDGPAARRSVEPDLDALGDGRRRHRAARPGRCCSAGTSARRSWSASSTTTPRPARRWPC